MRIRALVLVAGVGALGAVSVAAAEPIVVQDLKGDARARCVGDCQPGRDLRSVRVNREGDRLVVDVASFDTYTDAVGISACRPELHFWLDAAPPADVALPEHGCRFLTGGGRRKATARKLGLFGPRGAAARSRLVAPAFPEARRGTVIDAATGAAVSDQVAVDLSPTSTRFTIPVAAFGRSTLINMLVVSPGDASNADGTGDCSMDTAPDGGPFPVAFQAMAFRLDRLAAPNVPAPAPLLTGISTPGVIKTRFLTGVFSRTNSNAYLAGLGGVRLRLQADTVVLAGVVLKGYTGTTPGALPPAVRRSRPGSRARRPRSTPTGSTTWCAWSARATRPAHGPDGSRGPRCAAPPPSRSRSAASWAPWVDAPAAARPPSA